MAVLSELTRPWEIWLVHHTHVDIGYTEPQDVILRKHAEFVAQALDYCTATDALPEGARFCWTCEVAWTVKAFLARYPERGAEFFRRVREGRIEVTALYLQLTDLFTQELLEETTDYALALGRAHDFEVLTAMNDDVNGWPWGLPDLLARRGVRYMDTGINETRALGVRPRPMLFRWTGPEGGSVLFWHGNGYLHGNGLALTGAEGPERVAGYLKGLEAAGYPHHIIEVRIHGEHHDNAPPGLWLSEAVRAWNATHAAGPKLRLVNPRAWFAEVAAHWPAPVVEHRAGWPDWWADGNGTAAAESALVRQAQADLVTLRTLADVTGTPAPADRVERARDAAAFFCEHTWGAWCSTDDPNCLTSKAQWNTKAGYAYTAAVEAQSLVADHLAAAAAKTPDGQPCVLVFNPRADACTGLVELLVADADTGLVRPDWVPAPVRAGAGPAFHLVDCVSGEVIPLQREPAIADSARRAGQRIRFMAVAMPARGFHRYHLAAGDAPATSHCAVRKGVLTSPGVEITPAPDGAGIATVHDRVSGLDWGRPAEFALGEVVYESISGPFGREKLAAWTGIRRDAPITRTPIRFGAPDALFMPYGAGLRFTARNLPGSLRSLTLDVIVYDARPGVDLCYRLDKLPETEAEALYVAFPLAPPLATSDSRLATSGSALTVHLDVPGAVMRPGLDQVPGTATDWHSLQHYFAVSGGGQTVVVASPDIPLVQINGINSGQWQETLPAANGLVMSWVMNNYWFTNFPAAQGGRFEWRYSLTAMPGDFDRAAAERFARDVRQPMVAAVCT